MRRLTGAGLSLLAAGIAALLVGTPAAASQGGTPGAPPTVGEDTVYGNNLSVPLTVSPSVGDAAPLALRVDCPTTLVEPSGGMPTTIDGIDYYLQKTETVWSAPCTEATTTVSAVADWGDNLTVAPKLVTGKTIRVEVALFDQNGAGQKGFLVTKLTDDIDRLATYGIEADAATNKFVTGTTGFFSTHVWDAGATLTIQKWTGTAWDTGVTFPASAEVNSMGAVVYGYNWGVKHDYPEAGQYRFTFQVGTGTTIAGVEDTTTNVTHTDDSTSVTVNLLGKGGGGNTGDHGNPNK